MAIIALLLPACNKPAPPAPTFTVAFNTNGAIAILRQQVKPGGTVTKPADPALTGCNFSGWYTNNSLSIPYNFASPVNANITLHAKWLPAIEMVQVPGGSFLMGSDDTEDLDAAPPHKVTLNGFKISKYPITQGQYVSLAGYNPSEFASHDDAGDHPVENLNWYEAVEFCNVLSEREGLTPVYKISARIPAAGFPITAMDVAADWSAGGYRLPTEAEWEYAAKGGNGNGPYHVYSGSDDPLTVAWFNSGAGTYPETHPVGKKKPNGLGIYDMSGNVWEWCWDWFGAYSGAASTNPRGPSSGPGRVMRGGCWSLSDTVIRIAYRNYFDPVLTYGLIGFRVVRL